jgi:starch phosphorylase
VHLGELGPQDVVVQLVHGRVDPDDRFEAPVHTPMDPVEQIEGNRWQYRAQLTLDHSGPFGYSVRMVPMHPGLASVDEMGLQALPAGQASGDTERVVDISQGS